MRYTESLVSLVGGAVLLGASLYTLSSHADRLTPVIDVSVPGTSFHAVVYRDTGFFNVLGLGMGNTICMRDSNGASMVVHDLNSNFHLDGGEHYIGTIPPKQVPEYLQKLRDSL